MHTWHVKCHICNHLVLHLKIFLSFKICLSLKSLINYKLIQNNSYLCQKSHRFTRNARSNSSIGRSARRRVTTMCARRMWTDSCTIANLAKLLTVLDNGEIKLYLYRKVSSTCPRCGRKWRSLGYILNCKKYNLHVACMRKILVESWYEIYNGQRGRGRRRWTIVFWVSFLTPSVLKLNYLGWARFEGVELLCRPPRVVGLWSWPKWLGG